MGLKLSCGQQSQKCHVQRCNCSYGDEGIFDETGYDFAGPHVEERTTEFSSMHRTDSDGVLGLPYGGPTAGSGCLADPAHWINAVESLSHPRNIELYLLCSMYRVLVYLDTKTRLV